MWAYILAPIIVGIILFFVLPILEKPRDKFLRWTGLRHGAKTEMLVVDPNSGKIRRPSDNNVSTQNLVHSLKPYEITRAVESAPLLQRPEIARHYIGISLDCTGRLATMTREGERQVWVHIVVSASPNELKERVHIHFRVNPLDYTGLSLLKAGELIHVSGLIEKVGPDSISLSNSKIIS